MIFYIAIYLFFTFLLLNFFLLCSKICKNIKDKSPQNFWYVFATIVIWRVYGRYVMIGIGCK